MAEQSKKQLEQSGRFAKPIVTEILPALQFYKAEDYHQNYHTQHPIRYWWYRRNSGRDTFLKKVWSKSLHQKCKTKSL